MVNKRIEYKRLLFADGTLHGEVLAFNILLGKVKNDLRRGACVSYS
jgi:hypothetical protein